MSQKRSASPAMSTGMEMVLLRVGTVAPSFPCSPPGHTANDRMAKTIFNLSASPIGFGSILQFDLFMFFYPPAASPFMAASRCSSGTVRLPKRLPCRMGLVRVG